MTYAALLEDVSDTLDRDVETRLPRWLKLVEARLNRLLDDPEMEVLSETAATGDYTPLPADFGSMVSITNGNGALSAVGSVEFAGMSTVSGIPRYYAIVDGSIAFAPYNATTPITLVYRRNIPALTEAAPTNWLLERAPDVYLYGVLLQANAWEVDTEAAGNWKAMWDEAIAELRMDGARRKWGAGPIGPRIRRP